MTVTPVFQENDIVFFPYPTAHSDKIKGTITSLIIVANSFGQYNYEMKIRLDSDGGIVRVQTRLYPDGAFERVTQTPLPTYAVPFEFGDVVKGMTQTDSNRWEECEGYIGCFGITYLSKGIPCVWLDLVISESPERYASVLAISAKLIRECHEKAPETTTQNLYI